MFIDLKLRNKIKFLVIILVAFSTTKYHLVYNEKRKFVDLQNIDILKAVNADLLSPKFNNLKWITPSEYNENPLKELKLIKESIEIIKLDKREKMLITHYQFFSSILKENLNIPNRWYYTNNTFPASSLNIYYDEYIEKFYNKVNQKKIEVIYLAKSNSAEFKNINFSDLLKNNCFSVKKHNEMLESIKIKKCN